MFGVRKRKYRRIYAVIGSCLCGALWAYTAYRYASTDRSFGLPLAAALIFAVCAVMEIATYRKYGDARFHFNTAGKPGTPAPKSEKSHNI